MIPLLYQLSYIAMMGTCLSQEIYPVKQFEIKNLPLNG